MNVTRLKALRLALCVVAWSLAACGPADDAATDASAPGTGGGAGGAGGDAGGGAGGTGGSTGGGTGGGAGGAVGGGPGGGVGAAVTLRIASPPQPTFAEPGAPARFAVVATGPAAPSYQWQRADADDFVDIPDATSAHYTVAAAQPADAGARFRVVVRSGTETATSDTATLSIVGVWHGSVSLSSGWGNRETPTALTVDPRGQVIVVGNVGIGSPVVGVVYRRGADGSLAAWGTQPRAFGGGQRTEFDDVTTDSAGDVYVVGASDAPLTTGMAMAGGNDAVLLKLSGATGVALWGRSLGTAYSDRATAVAVDAQGAVYVAGYTGGLLPGAPAHGGGFDGFLAKFSASGERVWLRQFGAELDDGYVDEESGLAPRAVAGPSIHMALDADGRPVVALSGQYGEVGRNNDVFVVRFGADGQPVGAVHVHDLRRNDRVARVAVTPDGEIVVAGITEGEAAPGTGYQQDVFVLRLHADGSERSRLVQPLDPATHLIDAIVSGLAVDAAGDAYVACHAELFADTRGVVWLKVDRDGRLRWARAVGGEIDSGGIVADRMGRLFLARQDDGTTVWRLRPEDGVLYP